MPESLCLRITPMVLLPASQEYDMFAARKLEDFPSGEMFDNGPIDRGRSSRQKAGNGLDGGATSASFPTPGFVDPTAAQSSQARWKAAGGANVSNDLGIVSPDRTHREPYLPNIIDTDCVEPLMVTGFHDPYISNQRSLMQDSNGNVSSSSGSDPYLLKVGSTPGSDFNRTCDPYVSIGNDAPARKPNPERPGDANVCDGSNLRGSKDLMTMASKPYISKEKCIPGSKGEIVDRTCHPYNSNGRDSTGWKAKPSFTD
ncbi:hypothetical protein BSL78_13262 [Apostichopus japonicus]|uniref:Uncharacterized protein n=1 Tax=Stichopus japonicus TaxID=307972 RepID=A0A2G8KPG6_STIJA|nr:hypothetical protein BSL78_13262 [Apostichopus japonicus]